MPRTHYRTRRTSLLVSVRLLLSLSTCAIAGCVNPATPSERAPTVDVLDYVIGDATLWPRAGSHSMNQIVDTGSRQVCWVKYSNPRRFECWRWDEAYVYHQTDNAIDGNTGESYHFSDGRWLPRYMPIASGHMWTLDVADNQLTWFTAQCSVDAGRSGTFPYRQRAWLETRVDAGGDLGIRDTLVLEYAPYDPASGRTNAERFYFGKGAGWYRWQRDAAESEFARVRGASVAINREVWCSR